MQVFGNVATQPERRVTKAGKEYAEFRLAESQRSKPGSSSEEPTWFTVRLMKSNVPEFVKGDFVKVTGKLKADFYLNREGKPYGTLLILAFEASKIAKPAALKEEPKEIEDKSQRESKPQQEQERSPALASASGWSD